MQQYEQNEVWTALEPDITSETAVLLSRPPQPLLEQPPKRTIFYVLPSEESCLNVCSHVSVALVVGSPGLHKTTKSRPPNLGI